MVRLQSFQQRSTFLISMLRIGIHGLGFMGMMHYLAYQQLSGVQITAICESLPERRKGDWTGIKGNFGPQGTKMDLSGIKTYAEAGELLADPNIDLVDICLPPNQHAPMTIAALKAGKHVFSEKPIALSLADADAMTATAEAHKKLFMVGHVLPFLPAYAFVYEAVQTNKYGKLIGGHFDRVISDPVWLKDFYNMSTIGGPLLDLHIHDAHFIRLLFGMPKQVQSVGRLRGEVPEYFNTQFVFADPNCVVTSTSGCIFQQGRPFMARSEVHFEKATLVLDGGGVTILTEDGNSLPAEVPALDEVGWFENELKELTHSVSRGQVSPILGGTLARDALLIALKEMESIQKRHPVMCE
jgi:predicted dehydrogenase